LCRDVRGKEDEHIRNVALTHAIAVDVRSADFLKDNHRAYAHKARRKKIALVSVEVTNRHSSDARLLIGSSQLIAGGQAFPAESRRLILRKLSAFTWDFLVYLIVDFHPVTAAIEAFLFLTGPIYNWRLRRDLKRLTDADVPLTPGQSVQFVLGFRGVRSKPERLDLSVGDDRGESRVVSCEVQ
jgi:hypothetical protein